MLILLYSDSVGREHAVAITERPVTVGRENNADVALADPLVSRKHCTISERDGMLHVTDLSSRYGTWVDDRRVEGAHVSAAGAAKVVRVGGTSLRLIERRRENAGAARMKETNRITSSGTSGARTLEVALAEAKRLALGLVAAIDSGREPSAAAANVLEAISAAQSAAAALELDRSLALMLVEVSRVTATADDLESVLRLTMDLVLRALAGERGFILLRGEGDELVTRISRNMGDLRGISQSIARKVVHSGEAVRTTDAQVDPRFKDAASVMANIVRSVLCVPLRARNGQTIGAIYVDGMPGNPMFGTQGLEFLTAFAQHAASAIESSSTPHPVRAGGRT